MEHVAIDLGGRESQICVRSAAGAIVLETRCKTRELPNFLKTREPSRVVVETCAESFMVADAALELGHEIRVVPATLVPALGVGSRKTKNDKRDCRILSEASCRIDLPSVHIPSAQSRDRKTMMSMHDVLVASRTAMVNAVRGWMRGQAVRCSSGAVETFPTRVREALEGEVLPSHIERVLGAIDALTTQIRETVREIERVAKSDAACRLLMSMPGVGPITSVAFASTLDQLFVHLVWATQHRAPKLEPSVDAGLAALLERKARRLDARILAAGNAADHVHVLLRYPPRVPVAQIAHLLKGASSRALNRLAPNP